MPGYGEKDCALYKMRSKGRLARILLTRPGKLKELTKEGDFYSEWREKKKNGGFRHIEAPRPDLKRIQRRAADLLQRIAPPDFLFLPAKGRSYVENAAHHKGAKAFHTLDIADFYPHCSAARVAWFSGKRLQCSRDVTAILVGLTTRNGHLPQGSPCSPILAYFSYADMWEAIDAAVRDAGCSPSVYVDDLMISGDTVPGELIWEIKKIIHRHGHSYQSHKERRLVGSPTEVTGVIIRDDKLLLPNRQHKKMHDLERKIAATKSHQYREKLHRQLKGRKAQARQILFAKP